MGIRPLIPHLSSLIPYPLDDCYRNKKITTETLCPQ